MHGIYVFFHAHHSIGYLVALAAIAMFALGIYRSMKQHQDGD